MEEVQKKDFRNKISICKKEIQETKHWLRMIVRCVPQQKSKASILRQEAHELTLIFQSIMNKLD
jgi:four helix bundle protein